MEYHKIETLYERGDNFKVNVGAFKNRTYTLLKQWRWTEKIDGTNIRCIWQDGRVSFNGRTDNAQLNGGLVQHLHDTVRAEPLNSVFQGTKAILYGEGYGAGIQKNGGLLSLTKKFILFDVLVEDKWWLAHEDVVDVAAKLSLEVVPDYGLMTLEAATEFVKAGFKSRLNNGLADAEGLVGRPEETLFDKKGARLIVKLKTKDF